jgi:hypothetical protein
MHLRIKELSKVLTKKAKRKRNNLPGKRFGPPPKRGPNPQGLKNKNL